IAAACAVLLHQSLPEPPRFYRLTEARLRQGAVERPVSLPDHLQSRYTLDDPPVYSLSFEWHNDGSQRPWSVFLPRFMNGVEVAVNGTVILDSRRDRAANRPDRNAPELAVIPASLLREGANSLTIRLFVWGPLTGFLDSVYVGPDDELRPTHERRTL